MSHSSLDNLASPKFNGVGSPNTPQGTLRPPPSPYPFSTIASHNNSSLLNGSLHSLSFELDEKSFTNSPQELDVQATLRGLNRPRNLSEKARINAGWLDSCRSLMEQDIDRGTLLLLRFKYASYYDLNPKYDSVRVNQLFEQARWSLLTETIDCTEEDMVLFAALNHHIYSKARRGETDFVDGENNVDNVDSMLDELESALAGTHGLNTSIVIEHVPELCSQLQYVTNKPKKSLLPDLSKKRKQTSFFHLKEKTLSAYKRREDKDVTNPSWSVDLDECEVREEVNLSTRLFVIRLFTSLGSDGFSELCLHCDSQEQFKDWVTACKLASRGKTMADCSYQLEKDALQKKLDMLTFETSSPTERLSSAEMYVSPKYMKKHKSGIISKISAVCSNSKLNKMSINEAKMQYLKLWQDLPEQPLTYFIVRFDGSKKEELLAIAADKIVRMDLINGSVIQKWPFKNMNRWHVNWQTKQVCIEFREKTRENTVKFYCLTADCKTVHEFIGGYIFVGMRSADKSQTLDKSKFYKLTAGRE
ncbi:DgyrCDS8469 [Dimorphilus gyrociliatus]|nr:DgyrCDS8469 [Dimorphilus gyrociliatus]